MATLLYTTKMSMVSNLSETTYTNLATTRMCIFSKVTVSLHDAVTCYLFSPDVIFDI